MGANDRYRRVIGRIVPIVFGIAGLAVAGVVAALPSAMLERLVEALALPAIVPAAAAPLGATARTIVALALGLATGLFGFVPDLILYGRIPRRHPAAVRSDAPIVRRADAHPDAPPRRPIRATEELAPPPPPVRPPVPRDLPADLDQPLAAFDPAAIPPVPREPVRAVAALAPKIARPALIDPGERFESFELKPSGDTTIAALLDRLERGAQRVTAPRQPANLDATLGMLRRLATG